MLFRQLFSTYVCKKSCRNDICTKKHAKNVDEIDGWKMARQKIHFQTTKDKKKSVCVCAPQKRGKKCRIKRVELLSSKFTRSTQKSCFKSTENDYNFKADAEDRALGLH